MGAYRLEIELRHRIELIVPGATPAAAKRAARRHMKWWWEEIAGLDDFEITVTEKTGSVVEAS